MKYDSRESRDSDTCCYHDLICNSWVTLDAQLSLLVYRNEPGQECESGYSEVSESEIAIIETLVPQLVTELTNFDAWKRLVVCLAPNRDDEWHYTIIVFLNN